MPKKTVKSWRRLVENDGSRSGGIDRGQWYQLAIYRADRGRRYLAAIRFYAHPSKEPFQAIKECQDPVAVAAAANSARPAAHSAGRLLQVAQEPGVPLFYAHALKVHSRRELHASRRRGSRNLAERGRAQHRGQARIIHMIEQICGVPTKIEPPQAVAPELNRFCQA